MLTKTSIIVFFLSVMSKDVDPVFKWCNWLTLAVVNIIGLALTFFSIFQCSPVAAGYLYPQPKNAHCTDILTLYLSSAPVNIITDIAILFLPIPILTRMRLPRKQKIILVATFSFGAFVAIVDVIRIAYLQQAALNRLKGVKTSGSDPSRAVQESDFSWYASLSFMWSAVEICIGIICACVPALKPLFARFLPSFIKDASDEETTSGNSMDLGKPPAGVMTAAAHQAAGSEIPAKNGNLSMLNNPAAFRKPVVGEYTGDDEGDHMGFLNMLISAPPATSSDAGESTVLSRTATRLSRKATSKSAVSDFGFVNMSGARNMLTLSNKQSVWPIAVVTVIFFLWGFAYGLLDTLNSRFQIVAGISTGKTLGLHAAYYGGYFLGPLTLGRFILKRYGFKAVMIGGLSVYGCGTLVFWPSAVLTSYAAFVISNFIVGFGLSCLEIAANPYIALCGPLEYAEARLNLSQAFQAIGTVCSPLLATKVLFKSVNSAGSLVDVQWTYLGIALFVFALAVVFYYIPLPEASDSQLEDLANEHPSSDAYETRIRPWNVKVIYVTLGLGVFSQWCYVGGQECVGNIQPLISLVKPTSSLQPFDFQTVAHTIFAVGRFVTAALNFFLKPRWILLGLYLGLIVCLALTMHLGSDAAAAIAILTFFFEAGIFSTIFAIAMRGLGKHTKTGAALMTAAISGGAVFPPIQWAVESPGGKGLKYSYCVPVACAAFGALFAIYLNVVPEAKRQVDPVHIPQRSMERYVGNGARDFVIGDEKGQDELTTASPASSTIISRRKRNNHPKKRAESPSVPSVEHVERRNTASPVLTTDFAASSSPTAPPPVRHKPAKGHVANLALWPVGEDVSEASGSVTASGSGSSGFSNGGGSGGGGGGSNSRHDNNHNTSDQDPDSITPTIVHHRPIWEQQHRHGDGLDDDDDDDLDDDYHAVMRRI